MNIFSHATKQQKKQPERIWVLFQYYDFRQKIYYNIKPFNLDKFY